MCLDAPCLYAPVHSYTPHMFECSKGFRHPHVSPILLCASVCSHRLLHVVGACRGPLHVGHLPYMLDTFPCMGVPPYMSYTPHSFVGFPVYLYVSGISACVMGNIALMLGVWGVFPICWGLGASAPFDVHMLHLVPSCNSLCLMSHVSTTAMTTPPLVMVVSSGLSSVSSVTMAVSLMGLPATLGQHEVVLPPPLTLRGSEGVIGLAFVLQQQPQSLMPLLDYAHYAMGFPQMGFFFRDEPPTILYIMCLVSILMSAFYFQVPSWMPYSPMGPQPIGFLPLQPFGILPMAGNCATW